MSDLPAIKVTNLPYLDSASLFEKVATEPWAMFFDSGYIDSSAENVSHSLSSRYDVLVIEPESTVIFDGKVTHFNKKNGQDQRLYGDPIAILHSAIPNTKPPKKMPYLPGAYGYFSYDLSRQYENIESKAADVEDLPPMAMGIYSVVLVVDHKRKKTKVIRIGRSASAKLLERRWFELVVAHQEQLVTQEIAQIDSVISGDYDAKSANASTNLNANDLDFSLDWHNYQKAFARIRDYIVAGDCYQVNLTKQFSANVNGDPWTAYKDLRESSPAPYGCFMNLPFAQVLSNSPESFLSCRDGNVTTSPIKGTRVRNHFDTKADRDLAQNLYVSVKDRAENVMIVDLMRNDLSRACEYGSVKVPELFELHSFANVHHLISKVVGKLQSGLHSLDLFRVCFPAGSITGAPKVRAMQIIEELEPFRRGLYCGSIGYVGSNGDLETSVAIRTIVVKDGIARFSGGGGLVSDSEVIDEYQELNDKVSMMRAVVMSNSTII